MTNGTNFAQYAIEQTQAMSKLWMDSVSRMTGAAFAFTPGSSPPEMTREVREAFLSALGHSIEGYMRSEPFLQSMRQSLDVTMDLRKQFTQMMTQLQHGAGVAAYDDIRTLMLALRHMEERLGRRFDELSERLEAMECKLEGLDSQDIDSPEDEQTNEDLPSPGNGVQANPAPKASASKVVGRTARSGSRPRKSRKHP